MKKIILVILMLSVAVTGEAAVKNALYDQITGDVLCTGDQDFSSQIVINPNLAQAAIHPRWHHVDCERLIADGGNIRMRNESEMTVSLNKKRKKELKKEMVTVKKQSSAMQGIGGVDFGQEIAELNQRLQDLKNEYNSIP